LVSTAVNIPENRPKPRLDRDFPEVAFLLESRLQAVGGAGTRPGQSPPRRTG